MILRAITSLRRRGQIRQGQFGQGFTLIEMILVVAIIGILVGLLLPVLAKARSSARQSGCKNTMRAIVMALERYREDFKRYPPHDTIGTWGAPSAGPEGGSEILAYYLCTKITWGEMHYGPYLSVSETRLKSTSAPKQALVSPIGGYYKYMHLVEEDGSRRNFLVVDAALDGLFGGTLYEDKGFVIENKDDNADSIMDHIDNIYSSDKE